MFREKSRARVPELAKSAKAIVLVTHDMHRVTEFCNRATRIEKGHVVAEGEPEEIVRVHQEHSVAERARKQAELIAKLGDSPGFSPWAISTHAAVKAAKDAGQLSGSVEDIERQVRDSGMVPIAATGPAAPATPADAATPEGRGDNST